MYLSSQLILKLFIIETIISLAIFVVFILMNKIFRYRAWLVPLKLFSVFRWFLTLTLLAFFSTVVILNYLAEKEISSLHDNVKHYAKIKLLNSVMANHGTVVNTSTIEDKRTVFELMDKINNTELKKLFSKGKVATENYLEFVIYDDHGNQVRHFIIIGDYLLDMIDQDGKLKSRYISMNRNLLSDIRDYLQDLKGI
jgi:hypothetical protein